MYGIGLAPHGDLTPGVVVTGNTIEKTRLRASRSASRLQRGTQTLRGCVIQHNTLIDCGQATGLVGVGRYALFLCSTQARTVCTHNTVEDTGTHPNSSYAIVAGLTAATGVQLRGETWWYRAPAHRSTPSRTA